MGLLILLALGFVVYWTFLVLVTLDALRKPSRRSLAWCLARSQPFEPTELRTPREFECSEITEPAPTHSIRLTTRTTTCPVWTIPGDDPAGPVAIFSHGWGESKQAVLQRLDALAPVCSAIVSWDMPGHGDASPGACRLGINEHRALGELIETVAESLAPDRPIVLVGFSMGAGVSLRAAADNPDRVAAVIVEAPYRLPQTPAQNVMQLKGFPYRLNLRPALAITGLLADRNPTWQGFDRAAIASRLSCPLLVVHAIADEMCPLADGRAIADAAPDAEIVEIAGASHTDLWQQPEPREAAMQAVQAFIRSPKPAQGRTEHADG